MSQYEFRSASVRPDPQVREHRVLSVRVRRAGFLWEIGQPRIRRTEVRPIFRRRAISDLLMPAR